MRSKNMPLFPERYEVELYKDLIKKLNRLGFEFKEKTGYSDLVDELNRILVEIKLGRDVAEDGASQLLYEVAKNDLRDFSYLGLADSEMFHMFKSPEYGNILTFARTLDPKLSLSPSSFSGKKIADALIFLGKPVWQGFWRNTKDDISKILDGNAVIPFIAENLFDFHRIFGLYKIRTADIIAAFTGEEIKHIEVTKDHLIISKIKGEPVSILYKGHMKHTHRWILQRMRIPDIKAVEKLRHTSDRLQSDEKRVKRGAYYTENFLSIKMGGRVLEHINPDFIIEPYAGAGSLITPFIKDVFVGWINDYDEDAANMLKADFGSIGYRVTCEDMINFPLSKAISFIGNAENPLFITNPPFSSTSGKKLKEIKYDDHLCKKYGKGNQIYQDIGRVIEIIKKLGCGHLAFFSPMGIFCERKAHMKFLTELLNNFTFIEGFIWSGKHFNDVRPEIPVAFTIWKFGGSTNLEDIEFDCEEYGPVGFKHQPLLKDGWKYDNRKIIRGEIAVQHNSIFNDNPPKIFHNKTSKGGSEVIRENVKKPLNIVGIPDELAYALWSTVIGQKSLGRSSLEGYPLYDGAAYVHLPDFKMDEAKEILAYVLLYAFVGPDYTGGKIGFIGPRKVMRFGKSTRLNDGAKYLFDTYGHLPVGDQTISKVLNEIKNGKKPENARIEIVKEITSRLDVIGYWDYIPLPLKQNNSIFKEVSDK